MSAANGSHEQQIASASVNMQRAERAERRLAQATALLREAKVAIDDCHAYRSHHHFQTAIDIDAYLSAERGS